MLHLKDGGTYVRRDGQVVTVQKNTGPIWQKTHPFRGTANSFASTWTSGGIWSSDCVTKGKYDLIAEYQPLFTISAGNYYRTRDGRKAYVACGPVTVDCEFFGRYTLYFGFVKLDSTESTENSWGETGVMDCNQPDHADDLVAPWHPETLTDPTTGKKYRVAEEVA